MAHDPEMEVMHERVTQLERENARLCARLEDRERELRWLLDRLRRNE
jgi:hypothetical protein